MVRRGYSVSEVFHLIIHKLPWHFYIHFSILINIIPESHDDRPNFWICQDRQEYADLTNGGHRPRTQKFRGCKNMVSTSIFIYIYIYLFNYTYTYIYIYIWLINRILWYIWGQGMGRASVGLRLHSDDTSSALYLRQRCASFRDPGLRKAQGNRVCILVRHPSDLCFAVPKTWRWECFSRIGIETQLQRVQLQPLHAQSRCASHWCDGSEWGRHLLWSNSTLGAGLGPTLAQQCLQQVGEIDFHYQGHCALPSQYPADSCLACGHASPCSSLQEHHSGQSYGHVPSVLLFVPHWILLKSSRQLRETTNLLCSRCMLSQRNESKPTATSSLQLALCQRVSHTLCLQGREKALVVLLQHYIHWIWWWTSFHILWDSKKRTSHRSTSLCEWDFRIAG